MIADIRAVRVSIIRFVDDSYPGFVECRLFDAAGHEWIFREKVPVVTLVDLNERSCFPQPGMIACRISEKRMAGDGREIVRIDTEFPWHVESTTGQTRFEVFADQLTVIS